MMITHEYCSSDCRCANDCSDCGCNEGNLASRFSELAEDAKQEVFSAEECVCGFDELGRRLTRRRLAEIRPELISVVGNTPHGKVRFSLLPQLAPLQGGSLTDGVCGAVWKSQLDWLDENNRVYATDKIYHYSYSESLIEFLNDIFDTAAVEMTNFYFHTIKPTLEIVKARRDKKLGRVATQPEGDRKVYQDDRES